MFSPNVVVNSQTKLTQETVYYRGQNFETTSYPNGTVLWNSASQAVWNGTDYVLYVFRDLYKTQGKYIVQVGRVGVEIYDYYIKIFSPDMAEVRVYDERWEIERLVTRGKNVSWDVIGAQSGTPTYSVVEYADGVNITKSFHSWAGWLHIKYIFKEYLKHEVTFVSELAENTTFRVKQQWAGIVGTKVKDTTEKTISSTTELEGTRFTFMKKKNELSVYEDQWSARNYLNYVEADTSAQGMKCDFYFGNWTLATGESLVIDPTTATLNNPTVDGYVLYNGSIYTLNDTDTSLYISGVAGSNYRAYVKWDVTSISDDATIQDTIFKYHGESSGVDTEIYQIENDPLAAQAIYEDARNGTVYADVADFPEIGTDKQIDLGASADSDLQAQLTSNWFAIGLSTGGTTGPSSIYSEEYGSVTPPPTLYVTYIVDTTAPTYSNLSTSTTAAGASCQFNTTWTDETELATTGGYIFSTNNTGSWANETWTAFSSNPQSISTSKTLNSTVGQIVGWRYYANDTANNWNNTGIQTLTTTDGDAPTFSTITANSTVVGDPVTLNVTISDNVAVSHFIYSWNNTGSWVNQTTTAFSSNPSQHSGTWNTSKVTVSVKVYANNTSNNWGVSSQYNFSLTYEPTIGGFTVSSAIIEPNEFFFVNATVNDLDGYTDIANATIELSEGIIFKWDRLTDTFAETQDTSGYTKLGGLSESTVLNSTAYRVSYSLSLYANMTLGDVNVVSDNTVVTDYQGFTGSGSQTALFEFRSETQNAPSGSSGPSGVAPTEEPTPEPKEEPFGFQSERLITPSGLTESDYILFGILVFIIFTFAASAVYIARKTRKSKGRTSWKSDVNRISKRKNGTKMDKIKRRKS